MSVLVMVLLSFILIACSALCLFAGVLFFGKPLTKGCGKEECCRKKTVKINRKTCIVNALMNEIKDWSQWVVLSI